MSIRITDCTIRDGGYLLEKNAKPEFVKGIMKGLVKAGIDFVETGFLQSQCNGESIVYHNSKDVRKYLPKDHEKTEFLGFCDNSRYSYRELDDYDGESFRWMRISFAKHEIKEAIEFCDKVQKKGYLVQFNPMDALSYTDDDLINLIGNVNEISPGSVSIVDTFGSMYLEDLKHIFGIFDTKLNRDIAVGLHSHDNLGLSVALAETMIMLSDETERDVIVDGSLMGMGRGAGNASTELIASYLNAKKNANYDISELLRVISSFVLPLQDSIHWGYDLPMFICGIKHSHVDNYYYLQEHGCSIMDVYWILDNLDIEQRTRYGKNYSKTDFSALRKVYEGFKN